MGIGRYKKWSGEERERSLKLFNRCKQLGLLEPPRKCRICGQEKGILQTHNENYDITLAYLPKILAGTATKEEKEAVEQVLVPICWRCHMMHHSRWRDPVAVDRYFWEVRHGKKYPPVYKHDFSILEKENGLIPFDKKK